MLEPQSRTLLLDALRPPEDFELDFAIGTTYTLDLLALLTAPLGFTLHELHGAPEDELVGDGALLLLKTLRDYADRLTIFCEAGRITAPGRHSALFGYLESCVVQAAARSKHGAFHPKVWILRFSNRSSGEVCYRLLCLTRNLTFDRSWDTVLTLDGPFSDHRTRAYADVRPVAEFVRALKSMVVGRPLSPRMERDIAIAIDELPRVAFEVPEPFDDFRFHPLGLDGRPLWPFGPADRALVVSPFLSESTLIKLGGREGDSSVLISRLEELSRFAVPEPFSRVFHLNPDVVAEQLEDDAVGADGPERLLTGLHAKLYVLERGRRVSVYTGSANATTAAFSGNVEFLVELTGTRGKCGIETLLSAEAGQAGLQDLLVPFAPSDPVPPDAEDELLETAIDEARAAIGRRKWTATVDVDGQAVAVPAGEPTYGFTLSTPEIVVLPSCIRASIHPLSLPAAAQRMPTGRPVSISFGNVSFAAISSFFVVELNGVVGDRKLTTSFTVNAELVGGPADRREAITRELLNDPQKVVRFLMLLLSDSPEDMLETADSGADVIPGTQSRTYRSDGSNALLEPLLRALDRAPARLDATAEVIADLLAGDGGESKLPPGFDKIWRPIWDARQALED